MRPRRGSRLRGPRSLPYYTPPMCPRCALYTLRGIFLAGGIVTFRAIDRVFREASLLPRTCNHQLFPLFSLSLFYRILFLFFLTFSISYLSITRTIRDLSRSMHAEFRIRFFQITRDRGRRTNDRGYRNILGQKEARKICPATREKELENPSLLERTKR